MKNLIEIFCNIEICTSKHPNTHIHTRCILNLEFKFRFKWIDRPTTTTTTNEKNNNNNKLFINNNDDETDIMKEN